MTDEDANRIATAVQKLAYDVALLERRDLIDNLELFIKDYRMHGMVDAAGKVDASFKALVQVLTEVGS